MVQRETGMSPSEGVVHVAKGLRWGAAVLLVIGLAGCGSDADSGAPAGPPEKGTVVLRDISFKPDELKVKVGDTVTWRFDDKGINHDVVADDGSFKSEVQDSGTFRHTFDEAGRYPYVCTLHRAAMTGTIVVEP